MSVSNQKGTWHLPRALAQAVVLSITIACQRSPTGGAPKPTGDVAGAAPLPQPRPALAERLCGGRPGCIVRQTRALSGEGSLVDLAIPRVSSKEDCDGAEYWLIRGTTEALLASDCDAQAGADTRAHARVRIEPQQVVVDYEEGLSSDSCAGASARLSPLDFQIIDERRWGGTGRNGSCARNVEFTADWHAAKHGVRWSSRACSGRPANDSRVGDAIPSYETAGASEQTSLGSCAASLGSVVATAGSSASTARVRAAVVNAQLLVEVSGVTAGELSVIVAGKSPDDGFMGSVGCGTADEYRVSTATIDLDSGRVTTRGKQAPNLTLTAREGSSIRLYAPALTGIARLALSYRGPQGERVDSARLSAVPTAAELPPLDVWFQSKEPCELRSGRLETRTTLGPQPLLRLSGS